MTFSATGGTGYNCSRISRDAVLFVKRYLLAHGFGFTSDYWKNLVSLLDGEVHFLDDTGLDMSKTYIGIGHSIGFLQLNNSDVRFEALVALQGFLNFCGSTERMRKVRESAVERVRHGILEDKKASLTRFRSACGYQEPVDADIPMQRLLAELDMMKKAYTHCGVRTLVIGSREDTIVPMSLIRDNFGNLRNASMIQTDGVGHSLGYNMATFVAEKVDVFLQVQGKF